MKIPFSQAVFPPAPAIEVRLVNPLSAQRSPLYLAILDTGADISVVPAQILEQIQVYPLRREVAVGMWGGREVVQIFSLDFVIGSRMINGVEVIGSTEGTEILIGRNLSNQLRLLLDGTSYTLEFLE